MTDKITRMKELIEILEKASKMYYVESKSIMSDFEYDRLYDELVELEKETGMTLSNSPTINVEYEISKELEQVEHDSPMLSLSKTKLVEDLEDFLGDKEGILSWKLDGLTIVLTYQDGKLQRGVTRGTGIIGEVITENVKTFKNIPLTIPYKGKLVVRGEAVITYSDFNKMNEEIENEEEQYKNPRNLCSGSVRQLDSSVTAKRNVNCVIFSLISTEDFISNSKEEQYTWLSKQGFDVVERKLVNKENVKDIVLEYKEKIKTYDIPSDGLVLTYDDEKYGLSLGITAKYPKYSIAFKWQDETVETKIINVDWMTSRTGLINPVAVFEPVSIEGSIVSRASLHNVSILKSLNIGIDDKVLVYKANMIIPQIAANLTNSNNLVIPDKCPCCNHDTIIKKNNDIEYLYCTNDFCKAKLIKKLSLFVSRNAMNIDGISDAILTKFLNEGIISSYSDLYHLDKHKEEIINYEGFGEKSYNNIIDSVNNSRNIKLANFIYALGIPDIGLSRAKLICKKFNNDVNQIRSLKLEELSNIDGIGEIIAQEWIIAFNNEDFIKEFDSLLKEINFIDVSLDDAKLKDLSFVITGKLEHFDNRDILVELIENNGGKVLKAVSNNVNYLINNDINSMSSKNKKAKELNVKIITEEEFLNILN